MPNRILREGILTSPRIAKLKDWAEEVFYRRLHSVVDDFGRYYGDPGLLRAACFPRALRKVSEPDIVKWTRGIAEAGLVRTYEIEGEQYLELLDFRQQVRAKESRFPPPPSTCVSVATQAQSDEQQVPSNAHLDVDVSVVEDVDEIVGSRDESRSPANGSCVAYIPLNDGSEYGVSEDFCKELDRLYPAVDARQTLNEIRAWNLANPTRRKTKTGVLRHINAWFAKLQDKAPAH